MGAEGVVKLLHPCGKTLPKGFGIQGFKQSFQRKDRRDAVFKGQKCTEKA